MQNSKTPAKDHPYMFLVSWTWIICQVQYVNQTTLVRHQSRDLTLPSPGLLFFRLKINLEVEGSCIVFPLC